MTSQPQVNDASDAASPSSGESPRFRWPPKPIPINVSRPAVPAKPRGVVSPAGPRGSESRAAVPRRKPLLARLRGLWWEIEETFLDITAEPLPRRAARLGWAPDAIGAYCDRCGGSIGAHESDEFGCARCRGKSLPWDRFVRLGDYKHPLDRFVQEVKFTRWRALGHALGTLLADQLRSSGLRTDLPGGRVVVVPVPTSFRRRLSRGIDHSGAIASAVARSLRVPMVRALRRAHRPSQRSVPLSRRERNVAGSFRLRRRVDLAGATVILVDDVSTTGATMRAAARALRRASRPRAVTSMRQGPRTGARKQGRPAAIWACVVAVTPDRAEIDSASVASGPDVDFWSSLA